MRQKNLLKNVLALAFFGSMAFNLPAYAAKLPEGLSLEGVEISGLSLEEASNNIENYIDSLENKKVRLDIEGKMFDALYSELGLNYENKNEILSTLESYTQGNTIERYIKSADLEVTPVALTLDGGFDAQKVSDFVNHSAQGLEIEAKDATIKRADGKFLITESTEGLSIDEEKTIEALETGVSTATEGNTVEVKAVTAVTKPKVAADDLRQIKDVLGSFTTDFSTSSAARAKNLSVGTSKINSHILMPGETLSGYQCMAPLTIANGYDIAKAYENGQVVDSVAGGVCQIATTLYNAAIRAEMEITQRAPHSMTVAYVQASADAAIAGTYKDIKITNDTDYPMYIEGYVNGKKLTFNIWGVETRSSNRKIEFVSEILSSTPAGVTYEDDASLPLGTEQKVSSGHEGRKSRLWKVVTVNGVETERTLMSTDTYRMSNSIYKRGTAALPEQTAEVTTETGVQTQTEVSTDAPANTQSEEVIVVPAGPGA